MNLNPFEWFRGSLVVAWRDFTANATSVRGVFVSILMLLVMIGAAFGLSGLAPTGPGIQNEYVLWASPAYPTNGSAAGVVVWVADVFGEGRPDVDIALGEPVLPNDPDFVFRERATRITNGTGWVAFPDLGPGFWPLEMRVGILTSTSLVLLDPSPPPGNATLWLRRFEVLGDGAARDVGLQVMRPEGRPVAGAEVRLNGTLQGMTSGDGFFHLRLGAGVWSVAVDVAGERFGQDVFVTESLVSLPIASGPDSILFFLAYILMGVFGPIVAIALSYDALAKERFQGSLELLLVRPATRTGLAVGKFLGTFASVAVPVVGVQLASLAGIAGLTGEWPEAGFAAAFILGTMALLASYVLIMQIFSTFMKSAGTAILSAFFVWLVFNALWNLVILAGTAVLGIEGGTPEYFSFVASALLLNPSGVFQLTLTAYLPPHLLGAFGASLGGLPTWSGPVAFVMWIAGLLVVAVLVFKAKVV